MGGTVAALVLEPWLTVFGGAGIAFMPAVLNPLSNITMHVVHAPRIGRKACDGRGLPLVPFTAADQSFYTVWTVFENASARSAKSRTSILLRLGRAPLRIEDKG